MLFQGTKSAFIPLRPMGLLLFPPPPEVQKSIFVSHKEGKQCFSTLLSEELIFWTALHLPRGTKSLLAFSRLFFELRSRKYAKNQSICASRRIHEIFSALQGRRSTGAGNKSIPVYKIFSLFHPLPFSTFNFPDLDFPES